MFATTLSQKQQESLALLYAWLDDVIGLAENELDEIAEFLGDNRDNPGLDKA